MSIVALTNIYNGIKSYVPGEVIEGLSDKEEQRLIKLKVAEYVVHNKAVKKVIKAVK